MDETQLQQRIDELQGSHWKTIKAAASAVGIDSIPESDKWTDYAEEIAQREFATVAEENINVDASGSAPSPVTADDEPVATVQHSVVIRGIYPTEFYRANNIPFCELCGEKYLAGGDGKRLCPESLGRQCPAVA